MITAPTYVEWSVWETNDEQRAAHNLYVRAEQAAIKKAKPGCECPNWRGHTRPLNEAGHAEHVFGPAIHGVGIEFEESPLPAGHAFFHGEKEAPPLGANVVIAIGNCGIYTDLGGTCRGHGRHWSGRPRCTYEFSVRPVSHLNLAAAA